MEEPIPGHPQPPMVGKNKKSKTRAVVIILLVVLLAAALGVGVWLYMQKIQVEESNRHLNQEKTALQAQIDQLKSEDKQQAADNTTPCNDTPTASLKENIKAALDSKNTAVFTSYTSNPVTFVLAASEKGGSETPAQAASDMDYTHSATGPWDFNLPAATIASYDAGFYTNYFDANTYVGKAASGMVAAFDFDCDGKVSKIFLAADASLLL